MDIKKTNYPLKMGYTSKQIILKRENSYGWETLKEMFNVPSHQGNENQNYFESLILNLSEWSRLIKEITTHIGKDVG